MTGFDQVLGKHVLCAIDSSTHSWAALEFTVKNTVGPQDKLIVFHVINPDALRDSHTHRDEYRRDQMMHWHNKVSALVKSLALPHAIDFEVHAEFSSHPHACILEKIVGTKAPGKDTSSYDLVVVGARGLGRVAGMFLGSVSGHLLSNCPVPVVVFRDYP
ncbi:hypothetical protein HDV03_000857 [Kappamyces sp. JEL0829]|nr:hypothetical protein HDV03_000857 [Kappamyces sp. JEL0829]